MKIGVFGDSFADKNLTDSWWNFLHTKYKHDVTCFGEAGSSIVWSAKQIVELHNDFDFIIWAVTNSHRVTVWHRKNFQNQYFHVWGSMNQTHPDAEIQQKITVAEDFIRIAMDPVDREFIGRCVIEYVKNLVANLMLLPCFPTPIYDSVDTAGFNLYNLCEIETRHYFPTQDLFDIQKKWIDKRSGHLCESTHKILADKINQSLRPGIFACDYSEFVHGQIPFDWIFSPR